MTKRDSIFAWITLRDREVLGGCAGFAAFLLGLGRFSVLTGFDSHEVPSRGAFLAGLAVVLGASVIAVGVAALVGGAGRRGALRLLAFGLLASSAMTLLRTGGWESGWLAVFVLGAGVVVLALTLLPWSGWSESCEARADVSP